MEYTWFPVNAAFPGSAAAASMQSPRMRLLCFHGAGSDATMFTSRGTSKRPLSNHLVTYCEENEIQLLTAHLPGRTTRLQAKRLETTDDIVHNVLSALETLFPKDLRDVPIVLAGHSMGAFCAYEFACLMRSRDLGLPKHLILSCMVPPDTPQEQRPWQPQENLSSDQLKEECRRWGINEEVFLPEMWAMYEPILRSDFSVMDAYTFDAAKKPEGQQHKKYYRPLNVPTTLFFATEDTRIRPEKWTAGWKHILMGTHNDVGADNAGELTPTMFRRSEADGFQVVSIPGGHNFFYEPRGRETWMQKVTEVLDKVLIDLDYGL